MNTHTKTNDTRKPVRLVCATLAVFAALAAAAHADDVARVAVKYTDLNVATDAGAKVLYQRIRHAAGQVCGEADGRDLLGVTRVEACTRRAIADAVAAAQATKLTALYDAKMGIHQNRIDLAAR